MENRRYGNPVLLRKDGSARVRLNHYAFEEKDVKEGWLQEAIHQYPSLLPIGEIEPSFAPAVALAREVQVPSGFIDNLLISPAGYPTIVETKLWRNPQSRREVIGQIIDYAKDLRHWGYEDLDAAVKNFSQKTRGRPVGVWQTLMDAAGGDTPEESILIDSVSRNLSRGRLLLLIVGDGIREEVEGMTEFLSQTPNLLFTLALVELQLYQWNWDDGPALLLIPQVVARTREITRAVVRIEGGLVPQVHVDVDTIEQKSTAGGASRSTLTEQDFLNTLSQQVSPDDAAVAQRLLQDARDQGCIIDWMQGSFVVKYPDPGGDKVVIPVYEVNRAGQLGGGQTYRPFQSLGLVESISAEFIRELGVLFPGLESHRSIMGWWSRRVSLSELKPKVPEFLAAVDRFLVCIREARQQAHISREN